MAEWRCSTAVILADRFTPQSGRPGELFYAIAWCVDIPETVAKSDVGLRGLPDAYLAFAIPHIILSAVAAI